MKKIIVLICICSIIYSCSSNKEKTKSLKSPFAYAMPSHLYFKNMRSFHYEEIAGKEEGLSIYHFKKLQNRRTETVLEPVIYVNWLEDEAYLVFENKDRKIIENTTIQIVSKTKDTIDYTLKSDDFLSHQKMGIALLKEYQNSQIYEINADTKTPVLEDQSIRNQSLIVIADYLKLIE